MDATGSVSSAFQSRHEKVRIPTDDGRVLAGILFTPWAPAAAVVIHGGVGFPARYYQAFAAWLADQGVMVLVYDYRDFGASADRPLIQSDACLSDWGLKDQSAALDYLIARSEGLPVRVLGHSLGGQWLAFHRNARRVERAVTVASGPAYWLDHPLPMLPIVLGFWWLFGPLIAAIFGYMPGKRLGLGADIPAGVYWEWRKLCLHRDYHISEWGKAYPTPDLAAVRFPVTLMPIADDILIAPHMVRKSHRFYPETRIDEILLDPKAFGLKRIAHGGAFLEKNNACWPAIATALLRG